MIVPRALLGKSPTLAVPQKSLYWNLCRCKPDIPLHRIDFAPQSHRLVPRRVRCLMLMSAKKL